MPLYSIGQLLDKTFVVNKPINVYLVGDIIKDGDNANPYSILNKDATFVLYSYLLPTQGHTDIYGIKYAKRTHLYFTYRSGGTGYGVRVIDDGRFSLSALREQGALSVKEQIELDKYENMDFFEKMFYQVRQVFEGPIGSIVTIAVVAGGIYLLSKAEKKTR